MKINETFRPWRIKAAGFAYMTLALSPVYASDVEIYTRAVDSSTIAPVVMMMLDTSGSMGDCMTSNNSCSSPNRRTDVLKQAVKTVLFGDATTNPVPGYVKMGLSRYQDGSKTEGWVIYPARPLDAIVAISPDGALSGTMAGSANDTSGDTLTGDLVINATGAGLNFQDLAIPLGASITSATVTLTAKNSNANPTQWRTYVQDSGDAPIFSATTPLSSGSRSWISATSVVDIPAWTAGTSYSIDVKELLQTAVNNTAGNWCGGNAVALRLLDVGGQTRTAYSYDTDPTKDATLSVNFKIDPEKKDSCIKQTTTTTFNLGLSADASSIDSAQAKRDDVTWVEGGSSVNTSGSPISLNAVASGVKTRAAFRLGTLGFVPKGATINSASFVVTPASSLSASSTTSSKGVTTAYTIAGAQVQMFKATNAAAWCTSSGCTKPADAAANLTTSTTTVTPSSTTSGTPITIDVKTALQEVVNAATDANIYGVSVLTYNPSSSPDTDTGTSCGTKCTTTSQSLPVTSADGSTSNAPYLTVNWTGIVRDLSRYTTVRDELWSAVNGLPASSNTPLGAAYAQAALYLLGKAPYKAYTSSKDPDSRTVNSAKTQYVSPINRTDTCSGNYIFLLTDGAPTVDGGVQTATDNATGKSACTIPTTTPATTISGSGSSSTYDINWKCSFDLASTLSSATTNPLGVTIRTNAVFLGPDSSASDKKNMNTTATLGGGEFKNATSYKELVDMLVRTVNAAIDTNGIISSPGVSINQFNRLTSLSDIYYTLFDPSSISKRWNGNVKKYKVDPTGNGVLDADNILAVNADGSFKKDSRSLWSTVDDGGDSASGGAAAQLPAPDSRNMYTYVDTSKTSLDKIDMTSSTFISAVQAKMPTGVTTSTTKNLLNWYRGYDIADAYGAEVTNFTTVSQRKKLGGGLHSRAVLVNYGYTGTNPSDPATQNNVVFYSSLGSTLHAFDAATGVEKFAFIPGEKIPAIKTLYDNAISVEPEYGVDLTWTVLRSDADGNGQVTSGSSGDRLYMYGGMRMGGNNYYALDLTSLTAPKMLFTILGGSGAYTNLGQTWSQPVLADIKVGSTAKKVLVFGGGYDNCWENDLCGTTQAGNALYIVDAYTGTLLWWVTGTSVSASPAPVVNSDMQNSIPTSPKVLDLDGDGFADTIYFGDLRGQLFRADINNGQTGSDIVKRVKLVAKLGSSGVSSPSTADARRIYEPPSVALFQDTTLNRVFAAVAVGTGNRSRPLNTVVQDRYAVLFDFDVSRPDLLTVSSGLQPTIDYSNLSLLDLTVSTSNGKPTYTTGTNGVKSINKLGWYVNLPDLGEKSVSSGLIYLNHLFFNTYFPKTTTTTCNAVSGYTNSYEMCMPYGSQCDSITSRRTVNTIIGMAGEPQFVILKNANAATDAEKNKYHLIKCTGTNCSPPPATPSLPTLGPRHRWLELNRNPAQ